MTLIYMKLSSTHRCSSPSRNSMMIRFGIPVLLSRSLTIVLLSLLCFISTPPSLVCCVMSSAPAPATAGNSNITTNPFICHDLPLLISFSLSLTIPTAAAAAVAAVFAELTTTCNCCGKQTLFASHYFVLYFRIFLLTCAVLPFLPCRITCSPFLWLTLRFQRRDDSTQNSMAIVDIVPFRFFPL